MGGNCEIEKKMPPRYVSGVKTKVGTIEIPSKLLANAPLMRPARENRIDVNTSADTRTTTLWIARWVKKSPTTPTNAPTISPRITPPLTKPTITSQSDIGETKISSSVLVHLAK